MNEFFLSIYGDERLFGYKIVKMYNFNELSERVYSFRLSKAGIVKQHDIDVDFPCGFYGRYISYTLLHEMASHASKVKNKRSKFYVTKDTLEILNEANSSILAYNDVFVIKEEPADLDQTIFDLWMAK